MRGFRNEVLEATWIIYGTPQWLHIYCWGVFFCLLCVCVGCFFSVLGVCGGLFRLLELCFGAARLMRHRWLDKANRDISNPKLNDKLQMTRWVLQCPLRGSKLMGWENVFLLALRSRAWRYCRPTPAVALTSDPNLTYTRPRCHLCCHRCFSALLDGHIPLGPNCPRFDPLSSPWFPPAHFVVRFNGLAYGSVLMLNCMHCELGSFH